MLNQQKISPAIPQDRQRDSLKVSPATDILKRTYTKAKAINLSAMARATGIPYAYLYASFGNKGRNRPLSADEAVRVCKYLGEKVEDFADPEKEAGQKSPLDYPAVQWIEGRKEGH